MLSLTMHQTMLLDQLSTLEVPLRVLLNSAEQPNLFENYRDTARSIWKVTWRTSH